MGSFGTGSASHLAGEQFKMMAGVNLLHVPYRGGAPISRAEGEVRSVQQPDRYSTVFLSLKHPLRWLAFQ
jgi:hypothetical protein